MSLTKKAIGKRFGLLAALITALLIACTGVVVAQSSSTANAGYKNPNPVSAPTDASQAGAEPVSSGSASAGDVTVAASVPNGNFETGDFSHWKVRNQEGSDGDWFVYSGTTSPLSNFKIAAPPQGNFAATTDQDGPGSHVLFRNITLEPGMKHKLSFFLYYRNRAGGFFTPDTLDFTGDANQQYRVDLLKPDANPFSVDSNDILRTLFRTEVGDPNKLPPTLLTFNLTRFAGETVRLRFAEVDNGGELLASVDNVKVKSEPN